MITKAFIASCDCSYDKPRERECDLLDLQLRFLFRRYGGTYWKIRLSQHNDTKPPERRSKCDPSDWNSLVNCTLLQSCPACRTLQVPLPALLHLPRQSWWSCLATTNEPRASPLTERGREKKKHTFRDWKHLWWWGLCRHLAFCLQRTF